MSAWPAPARRPAASAHGAATSTATIAARTPLPTRREARRTPRESRRSTRRACARRPRSATSPPSSRIVALVAGPIEAMRGPASVPAASWKAVTALERGEDQQVGVERGGARRRRRAARRSCGRARGARPRAPRSRSASGSTSRASRARAISARRDVDARPAPRRGPRRRSAPGRCRARCRARAAPPRCRADRGDPSGRRARARRGRRSNSRAAPFGLVRHEQVEAGEVGELAPSSGSMRIAGASTTRAPSACRRAASALAWARARVTATVRPGSGRAGEPAELPRSAATGADDRDRRRARPARRRARARRSGPASPTTVRWSGERAALDDRRGLVGRAAGGDQLLGDLRQRAHAHVEDERAGERGERGQSIASRLAGSSWPVTNATALGESAMRHRDAGVGGRGDAGGDAGHDLERDPVLAQASASSPPRPKTNGSPPFSRTTSRPASACSTSSAFVSSCGTCSPPPILPTSMSSAPARARSSASPGSAVVEDDVGARDQLDARARVSRPGSPGPAPTRWTRRSTHPSTSAPAPSSRAATRRAERLGVVGAVAARRAARREPSARPTKRRAAASVGAALAWAPTGVWQSASSAPTSARSAAGRRARRMVERRAASAAAAARACERERRPGPRPGRAPSSSPRLGSRPSR